MLTMELTKTQVKIRTHVQKVDTHMGSNWAPDHANELWDQATLKHRWVFLKKNQHILP